MNRAAIFPTKYLAHADLGDKEVDVRIESTTLEEMSVEGGSEMKLVLSFVGAKKQMIANVTNYNIIASLYGEETDDWPGHWITLWVDTRIPFGSKLVSGIRVRGVRPRAELEAMAPKPDPTPAPPPAPAAPAFADVPDSEIPF